MGMGGGPAGELGSYQMRRGMRSCRRYGGSGASPAAWKLSHSIGFSGSVCPRSSKASGREDLEIEELISCGDGAAFHLHPTLPSMLGTTLVGHQVVQMGEPSQERLLAAFGMMESLHHE